ncbi:MAG: hypothetical protein Q8L97_02065 [Nitrosomonas sp.]|uniref:hypothetical protein n=1 Tax=Nitrosomonas sp. TaxID=42353 RepID=UPI00272F91D2|nr:hypothetical protein [Nitrosomonas sp.]MDP1548933.1 hypothetical protein [Nitrosomonas sp.]
MDKIEDEHGTWVFIVPVSNLVLTKDIGYEFKVDRITFIDSSKLPRIRKRLGFPSTLSEFKKRLPEVLDHFFGKSKTFATMRLTGVGCEMEELFLSHVRDELSLLTLSQLGYSRRNYQAIPYISEEGKTGSLSLLMLNVGKNSWVHSNQDTSKLGELRLDKEWINWQGSYFFPLLDIIRGKTKLSNSWRKDIRSAAILAGQSQQSTDRTKCFLWNMIALELLLTKQGDTYTDMLPKRVEAFLGWMTRWDSCKFEEQIRSIYKKRCAFVHAGDQSSVEISDILFSDVLILNVLINIAIHPVLFKSKEDLVNFSEKVEAEKVLGLKSKIRPKTITAILPIYRDDDYKKI